MSGYIESSIIIPVFNQWEYTRACLEAVAATTAGKACEVIVVDNASSDATPEQCPLLGAQLFGAMFRYQRCEANLNFGPASNLGAKMAQGTFLIFLNNDTVPLPGWYQPLIDDFSAYPDIAATGPVLLYPEDAIFGHTVQHLGVFVSPNLKVGHLYEGIAADCALAKKRRFFQIITAACMVMPRSIFMAAGMFDEHYVNGVEDVDICARLYSQGYRMTVNPDSRVVHHTSQTPGRHKHETENFAHLAQHSLSLLVPDWHLHLKNDGMFLKVGPWQTLQGALPLQQCQQLNRIAAVSARNEIRDLLVRYPLWEEGWQALVRADCDVDAEGSTAVQLAMLKLFPSPEGALGLYLHACMARDRAAASFAFSNLVGFCKEFEEYVTAAKSMHQWCAGIGMDELADQYTAWLEDASKFKVASYMPFMNKFWKIGQQLPLSPGAAWAYTLWRHRSELSQKPSVTAASTCTSLDKNIAFSVLMPVYNPQKEHLVAAIESVLAQQYPHWELCIADDASTDPVVKAVLDHYVSVDSRIRVTCRSENGHIAAATNTALAAAHHPYVALLDQDDLLAPEALRIVAEAIATHPDGLLFYSDEDKVNDDGSAFYPHFKNGKWDWELLYAQNFVNHLGVYRTDRMRDLGGFREGFRGAQDFDMLLRYTAGEDAARFVHIPQVLYHWRAHAGSTATDVRVKSEVEGSAIQAVQGHIESFVAGAVVSTIPNLQFLRLKLPLPEPRPLVSLILDMEESLPLLGAQLSALSARTGYGKYEILALHSETASRPFLAKVQRVLPKNVHLLAHAAGLAQPARLQMGAQHAQGRILGFLSGGVVPLTDGWLEELVSCLCRDGVGAVGGKLLSDRGTMLHGGYLADGSGRLTAIFRGLASEEPSWFGWNMLARTVDALDSLCLFTRAETLNLAGGFDVSMPHTAVWDYCLRLGEQGLRSVWWPFAEFFLPNAVEKTGQKSLSPYDAVVADPAFFARWADRFVPFNKNLVASGPGWTLFTGAAQDQHGGA
ncbi:glycosyltransferase [Desulfovibrio intestinalis]|uniref:GT2 family glycosyltransferase n=1 Tax=Desulfovibrio intestinalis TaxID=58621 RepID=A0A7W8FFS8_9BACT|nr:glycosyltransferase [Desulfovibrio intestinalis]MBB5143015.1 GT2 family glycosyltransferase [Desulfovibrio intestinalis]